MRIRRCALVVVATLAACSGGGPSAESADRISLEIVAGNNQQLVPLADVPVLPTVRVLRDGVPEAGAQVTFSVALGGGSGGGTVTSAGDGIARAPSWRLGPGTGEHRMVAAVNDHQGITALFSAYATQAQLHLEGFPTKRTWSGSSGTPNAYIQILDAQGQPVPNVEVVFEFISGPGHIIGADSHTNAAGIASLGNWSFSGPGTAVLQARPVKVFTVPATIEWYFTRT